MDPDLILTLGIVLLALSLPSFLAGWVEGRLARSGAVMVALSAAMIGWAIHARPDPMTFQDIPDIMLGVVARMLN